MLGSWSVMLSSSFCQSPSFSSNERVGMMSVLSVHGNGCGTHVVGSVPRGGQVSGSLGRWAGWGHRPGSAPFRPLVSPAFAPLGESSFLLSSARRLRCRRVKSKKDPLYIGDPGRRRRRRREGGDKLFPVRDL